MATRDIVTLAISPEREAYGMTVTDLTRSRHGEVLQRVMGRYAMTVTDPATMCYHYAKVLPDSFAGGAACDTNVDVAVPCQEGPRVDSEGR